MWWRLRLKCDDTCAETRFYLSSKRTSPFKSAGASVQSTTCSRGVRISGSNAGYTVFPGSVKSTGYPLHSPVSPSLPLPCVTVCHQVSTGLYDRIHHHLYQDVKKTLDQHGVSVFFLSIRPRVISPTQVGPSYWSFSIPGQLIERIAESSWPNWVGFSPLCLSMYESPDFT